jgi:Raf kinase inhibitor-like YbhB/YbcL family protein
VRVAVVLVLLALLLTGCTTGASGTSIPILAPSEAPSSMPTDTTRPARFMLTSPSFSDGAAIPSRHSCDGRDVSPPLAWSGVPAGTKALLLSVTDPDAGGFVHWVAWDLAPDLGTLTEGASGALPGAAVEGRNDFGRTGWGGPCPPSGTHRYVFTLTALSAPLGLPRGTELTAVRRQAAGTTVGEARLEGTYRR